MRQLIANSMKASRIVGVLILGLLLLSLLFTQAQPEEKKPKGNDPEAEARKLLEPFRVKLVKAKTPEETLAALKSLQALADELHGMDFGDSGVQGHRDPAVRR